MMARHPKRQQLAAWLDGSHDTELDDHLATCEKCASTLDQLSESQLTEPTTGGDRIGSALLTLLRPPDDLHERMSARLAERIQRRADLELLGSLLGVPREASELFLLSPERKPNVLGNTWSDDLHGIESSADDPR